MLPQLLLDIPISTTSCYSYIHNFSLLSLYPQLLVIPISSTSPCHPYIKNFFLLLLYPKVLHAISICISPTTPCYPCIHIFFLISLYPQLLFATPLSTRFSIIAGVALIRDSSDPNLRFYIVRGRPQMSQYKSGG